MTKSTLNNHYIQQLAAQWQETLNLQHWRIRISPYQPQKRNLLEISINRDRLLGSIRISEKALTKSKEEFEKLLIHELLHLVVDPMTEEFDFQKDSFPSDRVLEYTLRYVRQSEKVVESLSHILYDTINNMSP